MVLIVVMSCWLLTSCLFTQVSFLLLAFVFLPRSFSVDEQYNSILALGLPAFLLGTQARNLL